MNSAEYIKLATKMFEDFGLTAEEARENAIKANQLRKDMRSTFNTSASKVIEKNLMASISAKKEMESMIRPFSDNLWKTIAIKIKGLKK